MSYGRNFSFKALLGVLLPLIQRSLLVSFIRLQGSLFVIVLGLHSLLFAHESYMRILM